MNVEIPQNERRTQAQRSMEATTTLARAALEIIAEKGMRGLTLGAVSQRAGVSRGLPIYHFGSKGGLINHVLDSAMALRARLTAETGLTGLDALGQMLDTLHVRIQQDIVKARGQFILLAEGALTPEPEIRERIAEYNRSMREFYTDIFTQELNRADAPPGLDPKLLAANYVGMLRGILSQWVLESDSFDLGGAMQSFKRMLFQTVRPNQVYRVKESSPSKETDAG